MFRQSWTWALDRAIVAEFRKVILLSVGKSDLSVFLEHYCNAVGDGAQVQMSYWRSSLCKGCSEKDVAIVIRREEKWGFRYLWVWSRVVS